MARLLSKNEILMEGITFLPPCKPENIVGCERHCSSQLVRVLFLSLCILARNIYDHAFCLKMGNHRIRWYLGSQGEGQKSLDVNAGSAKDNRIYSNFRERQFFFNFIFFSIFRVTKKNYYISKT